MSEISGPSEVVSNIEDEMKEKLLDLALDEVDASRQPLERDVKPYLRSSNNKPRSLDAYDPFRERDEKEIRAADEDLYSRPNRRVSSEMVSELDRSRRHFDIKCGKLFVNNIVYEATDEDMQTLFGAFGRLRRAALNYDEKGRSRGTALVVFEDYGDAIRAFEALDGHFLDGRRLRLNVIESLGGYRDPDRRHVHKQKGDQKSVDKIQVFKDTKVITENDLDFEIDEYMKSRKRAKTWNYY